MRIKAVLNRENANLPIISQDIFAEHGDVTVTLRLSRSKYFKVWIGPDDKGLNFIYHYRYFNGETMRKLKMTNRQECSCLTYCWNYFSGKLND